MTNQEFLEMLGRDFPEAITALRKRWEGNLKRHGTKTWTTLTSQDHLSHLSFHMESLQHDRRDEDHGAAVGWRDIMYLQTRNGHSRNGK